MVIGEAAVAPDEEGKSVRCTRSLSYWGMLYCKTIAAILNWGIWCVQRPPAALHHRPPAVACSLTLKHFLLRILLVGVTLEAHAARVHPQ